MIRIAIVDDEIVFARQLRSVIEFLFEKEHMEIQSHVYKNAHDLVQAHHTSEFHLLFLDIDMPEMSGMELAAKIRETNSTATLIFVSSHSDFVFESFQFLPFRFIRKECLQEELPDAIQAYCENFRKNNEIIRFTLADKKMVSEKLSEIIYFFSIRHHICYITKSGTKELSAREYTMEKLESQLGKNGFLRIHKSYLLNYRYVYHIGTESVDLTIDTLSCLPISHRRISEIKKQYQFFMRGEDDI